MLTLVQRVFWNPLAHEENRKLTDIRPSEFIAAAVLVVLMVWIGVRPNDVLDRIRPSVETPPEDASRPSSAPPRTRGAPRHDAETSSQFTRADLAGDRAGDRARR